MTATLAAMAVALPGTAAVIAAGASGTAAAAPSSAHISASAGLLTGSVLSAALAGGSSISSDRAKIAQLEQVITQEGDRVQTLVVRYDQVSGELQVTLGRIAADQSHLKADQQAEASASAQLQQAAIAAYVDAASGTSPNLINPSSASSIPEQDVYVGVASSSLQNATAALQADKERTFGVQVRLKSEEAHQVELLRQLSSARAAAKASIATDWALLAHINANLAHLIDEAQRARELAQERAAEEALAVRTPPTPSPPPVVIQTAPGGYSNPFRSIANLSPNRIDQGVDYDGIGPVYAVGDGVVLCTVSGGWPGGTFIAYRLTDGRAAGLTVYVAEDLQPTVSVGQTVTPNTVIGQMYEGPNGIEIGWANGGLTNTMASLYGQFDGDNSTAFGYNFSQLLESLGAPGGQLVSGVGGTMPAGWPSW